MRTYGRRILYTNAKEITNENIISELTKILPSYLANVCEIDFLYNYYKGRQPILSRKKEVRPEICNKIVENRANEIVSFKTGYLVGEPIQYVSRNTSASNDVEKLNGFLLSENKAAKDEELSDWQNICGTSYRMILPKEDFNKDLGESPFDLITVNPKNAFVVYSTSLGNKPIYCCYTYKDSEKKTIYCVYTKDKYFEIEGMKLRTNSKPNYSISSQKDYLLGLLPIIEYPANKARLGSFEIVTDLLDAINLFDSNRLDAVEQFVQSLLILKNCELPEDEDGNTMDGNAIRQAGLIQLLSVGENKAEFEILSQQLDQAQNQTLKDDMYQTVLTIVGMPSQSNGGTSDSSNNGAVILKNGWQSAEARAKKSETIWRESETNAIKVMISICKNLNEIKMLPTDVSVKFTRRNYEDISTKANVLVSLLNNPKVAPIDAYTVCGLFPDPEEACDRGLKYYESSNGKETETNEEEINGTNTDKAIFGEV